MTTASFSIGINDDNILEIPDEKFSLTINDLLLPKHITHGNFHTAKVIIMSDEGTYLSIYVYACMYVCA